MLSNHARQSSTGEKTENSPGLGTQFSHPQLPLHCLGPSISTSASILELLDYPVKAVLHAVRKRHVLRTDLVSRHLKDCTHILQGEPVPLVRGNKGGSVGGVRCQTKFQDVIESNNLACACRNSRHPSDIFSTYVTIHEIDKQLFVSRCRRITDG